MSVKNSFWQIAKSTIMRLTVWISFFVATALLTAFVIHSWQSIATEQGYIDENASVQPVTTRGILGFGNVFELCFPPELVTRVGDEHIKTITKLSHLRKLDLSKSSISNSGLSELGILKSLEYLDVSKTCIDDSAVPILQKFRQLHYLDISKTNISQQGFLTLANQLQNTDVIYY